MLKKREKSGSPLPDRRVLFVQREVFGGLLLPFLSGTLNDTRREFEGMNKAIKERAEGRGSTKSRTP